MMVSESANPLMNTPKTQPTSADQSMAQIIQPQAAPFTTEAFEGAPIRGGRPPSSMDDGAEWLPDRFVPGCPPRGPSMRVIAEVQRRSSGTPIDLHTGTERSQAC